MINSTFTANTWDACNSDVLVPNYQGISGTVSAGTTGTIAYTLTDDCMLGDIEIIANGQAVGDTYSVQVYCSASPLPGGQPVPVGVVTQFATNINVRTDQQEQNAREAKFPRKLLAGLSVQIVYTSTGTSNVTVSANIDLLKITI